MRSRFEKGFRRTLIATAVNAALCGLALAQVQSGNAAETGDSNTSTPAVTAEP